MPQPPPLDLRTQQRVEAYLEADTRYSVAPIPTPVEPATAVAVVLPRITRAGSAETIRRVARMVIFHDLAATTGAWDRMLAGGEADPHTVAKSAWSVAALAWLGDQERRQRAAKAFGDLLLRADPERSHPDITEAALALGGDEQLQAMRTWLERRAAELEAQSKKPDPSRPPAAAQHLSVRADQLQQIVGMDIPGWKRTFATRAKAAALPPVPRAAKLAALYCETDEESDTPLVWWSACTLIRLPWKVDQDGKRAPDPELRTAIAEAFLAIARAHEREDPDNQEEIDLTRQRALHAAVFFGGVPTEQERLWLYKRPERGVDLLVLRPDFQYPAAHDHGATGATGHDH
ncbi:MAG: hypothetical protein WD749_15425 [Phycisphaerales bacterium]